MADESCKQLTGILVDENAGPHTTTLNPAAAAFNPPVIRYRWSDEVLGSFALQDGRRFVGGRHTGRGRWRWDYRNLLTHYCHNPLCVVEGHTTRECKGPVNVEGYIEACLACGFRDHRTDDCPLLIEMTVAQRNKHLYWLAAVLRGNLAPFAFSRFDYNEHGNSGIHPLSPAQALELQGDGTLLLQLSVLELRKQNARRFQPPVREEISTGNARGPEISRDVLEPEGIPLPPTPPHLRGRYDAASPASVQPVADKPKP